MNQALMEWVVRYFPGHTTDTLRAVCEEKNAREAAIKVATNLTSKQFPIYFDVQKVGSQKIDTIRLERGNDFIAEIVETNKD